MGDVVALSPLDQRWIRMLAHPTRIAILRHLLHAEDATPSELAGVLELPLGTVSYHMRCLRDADQLVLVRQVPHRGALANHYRLANPTATSDALRRIGLSTHTDTTTPASPDDVWQKARRMIVELRQRREAQGLTREALAARIHIKPSQLASIERGETDPRLTVMLDIAHELGTTLTAVLATTDP